MGTATQELTDRAKLLISERRYKEAVRACRRALLSKPGQVEIRLLLGEALLALERYDEVRVEMIALARKAPERGAVHRLLGEAYLRDGRPTQAVASLRRALQLDPGDEVAEELIAEAADESAPVSTTIERWFADEAEPTVETESPAWEEVGTPVPGATNPSTLVPVEPSVQVDPSLVEEAIAARAGRRAVRPEAGFQLSPAPAADAPLPPPPDKSVSPTRQLGLVPRPKKPSPVAPPPSAHPPAPSAPPPRAPFVRAQVPPPRPGRPTPEPLTSLIPSPASSAPPPPLPGSPTHAARPSRLRNVPEPVTDELSFDDLVPEDLEPVQIMEGEPTRARPSPVEESPRFEDFLASDSVDDAPTLAFGGLRDVDDELIGDPTRAHAPAAPSAIEPPTVDHYPAPSYRSTPYAEADEPATAPAGSPGAAGQFDPPTSRRPPGPTAKSRTEPPAPPAPTARVRPRRRGWFLPAITGALGLLVLGGVGTFLYTMWRASARTEELRAAAAEAGDVGTAAEFEAVIDRIGETDDPELMALKARLIATLTYEHGADRAGEVRTIIAQLNEADGVAVTDARIAAALISLATGDAGAAARNLDGGLDLYPGDQVPAAHRARAFAMAAQGDFGQALESATAAMQERPTASRHIALCALVGHLSGATAQANTLLDGVADADTRPAVRVVRARILADTGSDPVRAVQEATAVIEQLSDTATPYQIAWAHLIRASQGEPQNALGEARAAAEHTPPLDGAFMMELVRVLLHSGAASEADQQLGRMPDGLPVDRHARALLTAEVALALGDLARAETALGDAGAGSRRDLMQGQIHEARNATAAAIPLYRRVMNEDDGPEGRAAAVRLAHIALSDDDTAEVIALLEPRQPEAVDDLELVPLLGQAYVRANRLDDADRVINLALNRRPGAAALNAVHGAILLARGENEAAIAPLTAAAEARPRDALTRANLGRAHQLLGHATDATTAYEAALEIQPVNPRALIGLAQLAFGAGDFDTTETRLTAAANTGQEVLAVARLRAQLEVMRGSGADAVSLVRTLARQNRDAIIWTALGDLYTQAEADRGASHAYARALEIEAGRPEALLGQAFLQIRAGNASNARSLLTQVEAAAQVAGRGAALLPRVEAARGWLAFEDHDFDQAVAHANAAIEADEHDSSAHLLLGTVAIERGQDPTDHLRRAVAAHAPPPEALGQLVPRLTGDEQCTLARRYLAVCPDGYDAASVRRVVGRCG